MADFAQLAALSGRKNWSEVRADRLMSLQFLQQQEANQKQQVAEQNQAFQGLQEYYDSLKQISVLDEDLEKVQAKAKELEKPIIAGLSKFNGDVRKFMLSGGFTLLTEHKNALLASDEIHNAKGNALNYSQAMIDTYMGRDKRPVTYKDKSGNDVTTDYDTGLAAYKNGEIDTLPYAGSAQPVDTAKILEYIGQTYGKDKNVRQQANSKDIKNLAGSFGAEPWQAEKIAKEYDQTLMKGGTGAYFKSDDLAPRTWADMLNEQEYYKNQSGGGDDKETGLANIFTTLYMYGEKGFGGDELFTTKTQNFNFDGTMTEFRQAPNLGEGNMAVIAKQEGIEKDEEGMFHVKGGKGIFVSPKKIDSKRSKGLPDAFQYQISAEDDIYELNGFVNMVVDGERKTFISGKAKIDGLGKNIPPEYVSEDNKVRVLIPTEYNEAKVQQMVKDAGLAKSQEGIKGLRTNINTVNQQQVGNFINNDPNTRPSSIIDGGIDRVNADSLQQINDLGFGQYIAQIQKDPTTYSNAIKNIDFGKVVNTMAAKYKVPAGVIDAVIGIESSYNPLSIGTDGDMGLMQLLPATAKSYKVTNPFDPVQNIEGGTKMLSDLIKMWYKGDITQGLENGDQAAKNGLYTAIASYNYGSGNVQKLMNTYGDKWYNYLPQTTINYLNNLKDKTGL